MCDGGECKNIYATEKQQRLTAHSYKYSVVRKHTPRAGSLLPAAWVPVSLTGEGAGTEWPALDLRRAEGFESVTSRFPPHTLIQPLLLCQWHR